MARRLILSHLLSVVLMALAGGAVYKGATLARFDYETQGMNRADPQLAAAYADEIGVRATARSFLAPADLLASASADSLAEVLKVKPTSGVYWLGLAQILVDENEPNERVLAALRMSATVEPMEGRTVAKRVPFEFSIWEKLPGEERRAAMADLVRISPRLSASTRAELKRILAAKSEDTRNEIRQMASERSSLEKSFLSSIGL